MQRRSVAAVREWVGGAVGGGPWQDGEVGECVSHCKLSVGRLDTSMLLHKVVDEFCSLLVLQLFVSDPNLVQKLLPFR